MKKKIKYIQLFILLIVVIFTYCKPMDKTSQSTKQIHPMLQEIGETIGHNEILVTGILVIEDAIEYFIVDTIHQRGNTAPVIGKGEKIKITKFINSKPYKRFSSCDFYFFNT